MTAKTLPLGTAILKTTRATPRTDKLLHARQSAFLYIAVVTVYKMINLPTVLVERAGRDGWIASVILMIWELLIIVLFVALTVRFPGKTLQELLGKTCGKLVMRVFFALFGLFLLFRLYLSVVTTQQFLFTNLYDRGGWLTISLPIVVIMTYGAVKGLRAIARSVELIGIVMLFVMFAGVIAMLTQVDFQLLAPVLYDGGEPLWNAVESTMLGTGEGIVFMLLLGRVERFHLVRHMTGAYATSAFFVIGYNLCYYGYYGDTAVHLRAGAAMADMLQYMRGSDSLARMDLFVLLAVLILLLIKLLTYAWAVCVCCRTVFGMQDSHSARLWAFAPFGIALFVADIFLQSRAYEFITAIDLSWSLGIFVPYEIFLPLFVAVVYVIGCRKRRLGKKFRCRGLRRSP